MRQQRIQRVLGETLEALLCFWQCRRMKCAVSSGMSSRRSRSDGMGSVMTASR